MRFMAVGFHNRLKLIGCIFSLLTVSCAYFEAGYFESKVNEATIEMVASRYGAPHKEEKLADGRTVWTYYDRGSATTGYAGSARANYCQAYLLTFDEQKILRDWKKEFCR